MSMVQATNIPPREKMELSNFFWHDRFDKSVWVWS